MSNKIAAEEEFGTIIAGVGDSETRFNVPRSALEKSSILKGWIEDPETIPESTRINGALYFELCDPEAVRIVLDYLRKEAGSLASFEYDGQNAPLNAKVYKLAISLSLEALCDDVLQKMEGRKYSTQAFIELSSVVHESKLYENKKFRTWMMGYLALNTDTLSESAVLKQIIQNGGYTAWAFCSILLSFSGTGTSVTPNLASQSKKSPKISSQASQSSSKRVDLRNRKAPELPTVTRQSRLYSHSPQNVLSAKTNGYRVAKNKQQDRGKGKKHATVETDSEND